FVMGSNGNHCSFVLLAEFHIFEGAQLKYQFPQPLGVDEGVLAMSMLPDGAEMQQDDWTVFFLNQTSFNTISPVLALETPETKAVPLPGEQDESPRDKPDLLCVLNLVRTKHDKTLNRGAKVLALAICTRHPFIQIFKVCKVSDSASILLIVTIKPFLLMALDDYFSDPSQDCLARLFDAVNAMDLSGAPLLTRQEKVVMRSSERKDIFSEKLATREPNWNGNNPPLGAKSILQHKSTNSGESYLRTPMLPYLDLHSRPGLAKDTHFYHTTVAYKDHPIPIKMPLFTFPEEVGDVRLLYTNQINSLIFKKYSLITLFKEFSSHQNVSGPQHPHLHTNGPQTHPIIILFNALVTGKRIIFLGHRRPAGEVSSFVLSACALGSGCGAVLRGFIERAFPYANLNNRDEWESVPAYIAGVTNPIFESLRAWDLLLVIGAGSITVAKDIHTTYPVTATPSLGTSVLSRSGTLKAEPSITSEDGDLPRVGSNQGSRPDFFKSDNNADKVFIEDIRSAIDDHFGESVVRMRFTEYVTRFVRLASRYEEEVTGSTKIGHPSSSFLEQPGRRAQLGSGIALSDEAASMKELTANAQRIEAWRKTNSYQYCVADFAKFQANSAIRGFDVMHQLIRLRHGKALIDAEAALIMRTFADNVKTYEQVIELLAFLIPHGGGLIPLGFGLFHQKESVREATIDLFNQLRAYPVGVLFLQSLNHFQRYAYVRQAHAREKRILNEQQQLLQQQHTAQPLPTRAHSNSIVGGGLNGHAY
ncbi:Protein mesA, partial [Termitomyces sp. J132]